MTEPARLVVWDLDETFWRGTLSEGGIAFVEEHKNIVIELARRGIVSSICSKNDFETARRILTEHGIWGYFVLPSINWDAKGPRLAALIESIQLRPATVVFIDDNHLNREEAKRFIPDLQVQDETTIAGLLNNPLFEGKDDSSLSRLRQYKLLEQRKADEASVGQDRVQFLRDSQIRVFLEYDVEKHLDRYIELVNRTNQLNFTKERLPEDKTEATRILREMFSQEEAKFALVRVVDRYGDHGYCGAFYYDGIKRQLVHFCFSCRILGMGVELWLYHKLFCPPIDVRGEVLTDLFDRSHVPDWINLPGAGEAPKQGNSSFVFNRISARGSCELGVVNHYFANYFPDSVGEFPVWDREGGTFRIDHSAILRIAARGISSTELAVAEQVGYRPEDFRSSVFDNVRGDHIVLLSFGADVGHSLYRHKSLDLHLPFPIHVGGKMHLDMCGLSDEELEIGCAPWRKQALQCLRQEFEFAGVIQEQQFADNLTTALKCISPRTRVLILEMLEERYQLDSRIFEPEQRMIEVNAWVRKTSAAFPNVQVLRMADFIDHPSEIRDCLHFARSVYYRIYKGIRDRISGGLDIVAG